MAGGYHPFIKGSIKSYLVFKTNISPFKPLGYFKANILHIKEFSLEISPTRGRPILLIDIRTWQDMHIVFCKKILTVRGYKGDMFVFEEFVFVIWLYYYCY